MLWLPLSKALTPTSPIARTRRPHTCADLPRDALRMRRTGGDGDGAGIGCPAKPGVERADPEQGPDRLQLRRADQQQQVGERLLAAAVGLEERKSLKRSVDGPIEQADVERDQRAEAAKSAPSSSSRKRLSDIPVEQQDVERDQRATAAGVFTQVGGRLSAAMTTPVSSLNLLQPL